MNEGLMRTSEVRDLLGHQDTASTRAWLARYGVSAEARDTTTGEKLYRAADIEAARRRAPGQGARSDLKEPRSHDDDLRGRRPD